MQCVTSSKLHNNCNLNISIKFNNQTRMQLRNMLRAHTTTCATVTMKYNVASIRGPSSWLTFHFVAENGYI